MAVLASKRLAGTAAAEEALRQSKKRKTAPTPTVPATPDHTSKSGSTPKKGKKIQKPHADSREPARPSTTTVVPATPGTRVHPLPTTKRKKGAGGAGKEGADNSEADGGAPLEQQGQGGKEKHGPQRSAKKQKREQAQQNQAPSTLPTEPHASFLAELQPHHDVRILSVISSSRMEKRIKAVLEQLEGRQRQLPGAGPLTTAQSEGTAEKTLPAPVPGVVLLHARASDASKMISIVEIVKRRIREGCFGDSAAGAVDAPAEERNGTEEETTKKQTKKRKQQKKRRATQGQTAWYQYNRLYDVESSASSAATGHAANGEDEAEDDDGFEPMPQQFQEALADKNPSSTVTTTYMSIVLSRVPLPVLERHPEITAQASDDPIETEYQTWIGSMA